MTGWARRLRGAIGMGLTWAVCWGVCGFLIGASSLLLPFLPWEIFFNVFDAPLPALAIPGFFGGVIFSIVVSVLGHDRRFHELSLKKFAAWGAVGGLLLLLIPVLGFSSAPGEFARLLPALAVIAGPFAVLGAISASGSLLVARKAEGKALPGEGERALLGE
jgi:hypothetical protein